jgi:membrane-associated phospholipid phosphatase
MGRDHHDIPNDADLRHASAPPWLYVLALFVLVAAGYVFGEMAKAARRDANDGIAGVMAIPAQPVSDELDLAIPVWVRMHAGQWPNATRFFQIVTLLGNFAVGDCLILIIALELVLLHRDRIAGIRRADAFFWVGVTMGGRLLNVLLKLHFNRERPPVEYWLIAATGRSFPSGHAVFAGVFFGMLALLIARGAPGRSAWLRTLGVLTCFTLALLVAASRVWLGVHYPTDVIGGLLLGLGWVIAAWLVRSNWARWRYRTLVRSRA